jgi:hypothetical protein
MLQKAGVPREALNTKGLGADSPMADLDPKDPRQRRIELIIPTTTTKVEDVTKRLRRKHVWVGEAQTTDQQVRRPAVGAEDTTHSKPKEPTSDAKVPNLQE